METETVASASVSVSASVASVNQALIISIKVLINRQQLLTKNRETTHNISKESKEWEVR